MARLTVPALVISITDDAFAPEIAVRRFLMGVSSAPAVRRVVGPPTNDGRPLGHYAYFRRAAAGLWQIVSKFISS
jgi:predicted alpha/beta hydrolase